MSSTSDGDTANAGAPGTPGMISVVPTWSAVGWREARNAAVALATAAACAAATAGGNPAAMNCAVNDCVKLAVTPARATANEGAYAFAATNTPFPPKAGNVF